MTTKRIEARLNIKAVDQYSSKLKGMRSVTGRFADQVRKDLGGLQKLRGSLKLIEDFKTQQRVVRKSGDALEVAREKQRRLLAEIKRTPKPTAAMRRAFDLARKSTERLEQKHHQNRRALHGLQGQMRQAGVNTGDLAGEQRRLAGALEKSNASFGHQVERLKRLEQMQGRIAESRARMDRSLATAANLSFVGGASMQTGRRILQGMHTPIAEAIEFESAMSDVRKVVDFDSPEAFRQMGEDILKLSTEVPMSTSAIAMLAATGGQLGVAREDLIAFSIDAAKIGIAFDISAEHAATSLGKMGKALELSRADTVKLFDAMNHVSNNSAARADQTLDFLNRAGAPGKSFGFDPKETLAIGSAMIAAGAKADTAATSFQNMGRALTKGESATKRQSLAFKTLGLNAEDVAKRMQQDAVATTQDVLRRLTELPAHVQASTMSDLFGDEARELTKLLSNMQLLPEMLGMVADETKYLGSAEKEYQARAATTANNLQLTRNQLTRLGISIGEVVLPPLNDLLERSQAIIDRFVEWTKAHPKLTKWLVTGGLAIGVMAVAGGALLTAAAGLIGTLAVLRFGLAGLGLRAAFAAGDLLGIGRTFGGLRRLAPFALAALLKPVKWTSALFPRLSKLRFRKLVTGGSRLAINALISPLKWTGALLPNFAPALARFVGFRQDASAEVGQLSKDVTRQSKSMQRSLSRVKWGAFSAGAMAYMAMRKVPEDPAELKEFQEGNLRTMDNAFRNTPGVSHLMKGYERAFEWAHGKPAPVSRALLPDDPATRDAADTVQRFAGDDGLPTSDRLQQLREDVAAYREEVDAAQAVLAELPKTTSGIVNPLEVLAKQDLDAAQAGLRQAEARLADVEKAAGQLGDALKVLSGLKAAPEIDASSIERALRKIERLSQKMRSLPTAGTGGVSAPKPAGARARGGPVQRGLPYLVNENTPRSEWFVPSLSGGILNVSQAKSVFRSFLGANSPSRPRRAASAAPFAVGASRVRAAGLAALSAAVVATPAAAVGSGGAAGTKGDVRVEIHGGIHIKVPSGVSDPETIADLVAEKIGDRVSGVIDASFAD